MAWDSQHDETTCAGAFNLGLDMHDDTSETGIPESGFVPVGCEARRCLAARRCN